MGNISTTTDTLFAPLTVATAPEASRPMLERVQKSLGFLPNLMAIFANNARQSWKGISRWVQCSRRAPLHQERETDHSAGCECREQLQFAQPHIHK